MAMAADNAIITERELRDAFKRSGLWRRGWTYERAINNDLVLMGMRGAVRSMRKKFETQHGKPAPLQQALI